MNYNAFIDITGRRFTRLVAIHRDDSASDKHRRAVWVCRCDCGSIVHVPYWSLVNGHKKSCGCLMHDKRITINDDLTGRKIGSLSVLRPMNKAGLPKAKYRVYWLCRCDCRKKVIVSDKALRNGGVRSCGCVAGSNHGNVSLGNPDDPVWSDFPQNFLVGPVHGRKTSTMDISHAVGVKKYRRGYIAVFEMEGIAVELGCFSTVDDAVETRRRIQQECASQILDDWEHFMSAGLDAYAAIKEIKKNVRYLLNMKCTKLVAHASGIETRSDS